MLEGKVQVYTGNGKGKTTAAIGLAIRASGQKKKIYFAQFMKARFSGEEEVFNKLDNIIIEKFWRKPQCISKDEVKKEHIKITQKALLKIKDELISGKYNVVILDEILVASYFGLINENDILELIESKPKDCELVLTGRYATENIIEKADLVTEMKEVKHYYADGVLEREGIEY
ncbi:MAG: cob(I)yrinic acid a,c-diamide adenosyltransferase [Pseudomonadota bacterium]